MALHVASPTGQCGDGNRLPFVMQHVSSRFEVIRGDSLLWNVRGFSQGYPGLRHSFAGMPNARLECRRTAGKVDACRILELLAGV